MIAILEDDRKNFAVAESIEDGDSTSQGKKNSLLGL